LSEERVKTFYKEERLLNDFLSQKDIEYVDLFVRPLEYVVIYKKIKKQKKKVA